MRIVMSGGHTITDPVQIEQFRKRTLLKGLELEMRGMKRRGRSCYSIIKEEFGLRGSQRSVHEQLKALLDGEGS